MVWLRCFLSGHSTYFMNSLFSILKEKRYFWTAFLAAALYLIIYSFTTRQLVFTGRSHKVQSSQFLKLSPEWLDLSFRQRTAFSYEPIGVLHAGNFDLFISIPNFAIAFFLGILVGLNLVVSYYSFHSLSLLGVRGSI